MDARARSRPRRIPLAGVALLAALLIGCAAPPPETAASIPHERYAEAFQAAKDVLRSNHFDLARVDAARGVIVTRARSSAGPATPWIDHADSPGESIGDLLHRDRRRATVRFGPVSDPDAGPLVDRRVIEEALVLDVRVDVERTYVTGRRADATSIRLTSRAVDPALVGAGLHPTSRGEVRRDEDLAARLDRAIRASLASGAGPD